MTSGGNPARVTPPFEAGERATLTAFLDFQRATLALKCDGLTDHQLKERAVPPSSLSLLGIVRHMAEVERNWFRPVLGGEEMATIFAPDMDFEAAFRDAATAEAAEAFRIWHAECDHARMLVTAAPSLDVRGSRGFRRRSWFSLRWVLTHMIEEYARHNGHADLLRERLDGSTGELESRGTADAAGTRHPARLTSGASGLLPSGACGSPTSVTLT